MIPISGTNTIIGVRLAPPDVTYMIICVLGLLAHSLSTVLFIPSDRQQPSLMLGFLEARSKNESSGKMLHFLYFTNNHILWNTVF